MIAALLFQAALTPTPADTCIGIRLRRRPVLQATPVPTPLPTPTFPASLCRVRVPSDPTQTCFICWTPGNKQQSPCPTPIAAVPDCY